MTIPHWALKHVSYISKIGIKSDIHDPEKYSREKWTEIEDRILVSYLRECNSKNNPEIEETTDIYLQYMNYRKTKETIKKKQYFVKICKALSKAGMYSTYQKVLIQRNMKAASASLGNLTVVSIILNEHFIQDRHISQGIACRVWDNDLWEWLRTNTKYSYFVDCSHHFVMFNNDTDHALFKLIYN